MSEVGAGGAPTKVERAEGCLYGLAVGDALGMPTQLLSGAEVARRFGVVDGFLAPDADHPLAAGLAAGTVTDDTEQAVLLARHLVAHGGHVDPLGFAGELVAWEAEMRRRGSLDLLGPSTRAAVAAIQAGTPVTASGRAGTTNGAAMRVAPVGLVVAPGAALVERVVEASALTHDTGVALAAAAAVAAAVSAAIEGAPVPGMVAAAVTAARAAAGRAATPATADVAALVAGAVAGADPDRPERSVAAAAARLGTSLAAEESVPVAFAVLAAHPGDPWAACCAAASLGGDADTIAAMVGAMAGAAHPRRLPASAVATVAQVNRLDLAPLAAALVALR